MNAFFEQFVIWFRMRPLTIAAIVFTLLIAAANVFLWHGRDDAAQKLAQVRGEAEQLVRTLAHRPRIERDLAALRDALAYIDKNLVDEQSMEVNLGYFYRLEKATRVRLVRLNQLAAPVPAAGVLYKVIPFSMHVTGSYRNNMNFLRSLETGPRMLRVRNCTFERAGGDNNEVTIDLTVEVLART
jgi:Tfp pilus assembly protein PilO